MPLRCTLKSGKSYVYFTTIEQSKKTGACPLSLWSVEVLIHKGSAELPSACPGGAPVSQACHLMALTGRRRQTPKGGGGSPECGLPFTFLGRAATALIAIREPGEQSQEGNLKGL